MEIRQTTAADLECLWNKNIAKSPDDERWVHWKKEYIEYNQSGKAITFCVASEEGAVGEGTLLLSPECKAVAGRSELCNGSDVANINALRIEKAYEGRGHISSLVKEIEKYASAHGISVLTIGVEAKETRNLAIYLHWGYTKFLLSEIEDGELILYFAKNL